MILKYIFPIIAIIAVLGIGYFIRSRNSVEIPQADGAAIDKAIADWDIVAPKGALFIATQKETVVAVMTESVDQLVAYKSAIKKDWILLDNQRIIQNSDFTVEGESSKVEYCTWARPDGRFNVVCLCYNVMIVFLIVDEPL